MTQLFSLIKAEWPHAMSMEAHLIRISALLQINYEYFEHELPDHIIRMHASDLSRFTFDEVKWALDEYRTIDPPPGHRKLAPKPYQLIALLEPKMTQMELAEKISANLIYLVITWGNPNWKEVDKKITPEGRAIVKEEGGWENFCRKIDEKDITQWSSQLRLKAASMLKRMEQQERYAALQAVREKSALERPQQPALQKGLSSMSEIMQKVQAHMPPEAKHVQ